ncbi:MAG: type IV pilus biogenesis/stability protein PilW [Gammaproteobacteria bacterium]
MSLRNLTVILLAVHLLSGCISTETDPVEISLDDAARANLQLGVAFLQRGDLKAARDKLEKSVSQDPELPAARAYLGLLYERLNETKDADTQYRAALRLAPKDPSILNTYGGFLCRTGEREKGIEYLLKAAENPLYTTPETAYANAAICARGIPDLEAAETYLRRALRVDPYYRAALLELAEISLESGRPLQTRAFIQRFLDAGPATAEILILGADAEVQLGDEEAEASYLLRLQNEFPDQAYELRQRQSGGDGG